MFIVDDLTQKSIEYFKRILKKMKSVSDSKKYIIAGYSIYHTLKMENVPLSMKTISIFTGLSWKKLMKFDNNISAPPQPVNVSTMLASKYRHFNLGNSDLELLTRVTDNYKNKSFSPPTLAASVIYLYCKVKSIPIKLNIVLNTFGVSIMSVHRCRKYLASDFNSILRSCVHLESP